MNRGCDAADGQRSWWERRRKGDRRRAHFPAAWPLILLAWVWLERSRLEVIPFQRPLASSPRSQRVSRTILLKCNIHSTNGAALSTRVLPRGEAGDSPLPSSVKVLLEPAGEPGQPQTLPPAVVECPTHSLLAGHTLLPRPFSVSKDPLYLPHPPRGSVCVADSPSHSAPD